MDTKPPQGFEIPTSATEHVKVIGREMPLAFTLYDSLSEKKDITVYSDAASIIRKGHATTVVSERELFDDLIDFCARCRDLPVEEADKPYGRDTAIQGIDTFLDSMTFLSKEMYTEAVQGFAEHHGAWLSEHAEKRLLFVVPTNRARKSQAKVATDIVRSLPKEVQSTASITLSGDLQADMVDADTRIVFTDDWSVSGNHIANDLGGVFQRLEALKVDPHVLDIEVDLLLARTDQVNEGISSITRIKQYFPEFLEREPKLVAYFEAPVTYGMTTPTGSHCSADYGFATELDAMLTVAQREGAADRMPYIAVIKPDYSSE